MTNETEADAPCVDETFEEEFLEAGDLTPRQRYFVQEFLIDCKPAKAAERSGYVAGHGRQLLEMPKIRAAIGEAMRQRSARTKITQDYVISKIVETVEKCSEAIPVLNKDGEPTGEYRFDSSGALKGLDMLGKHVGAFAERLELTGKDGAPLNEPMSDLELARRVAVILTKAKQEIDRPVVDSR